MHPNDNLGYWLFYSQRSVAYAFSEVLRQCCLEHNKPVITPPQWGVIALLYETDGLTIGSISQQRGVDAPTITGIVKRLEQSGLLERVHNREDRRVVKVYLTAEGRDISTLLIEPANTFYQVMTQDFSEADQYNLLINLQRIIANVSRVASGTSDRFGLLPHDFLCNLEEELNSHSTQRKEDIYE